MTKRITLTKKYRDWQPGVTIELESDEQRSDIEKADELIKRGIGVAAKDARAYNTEDEMPEKVRVPALAAYEAAEAAGGPREQHARAVATAPWRK